MNSNYSGPINLGNPLELTIKEIVQLINKDKKISNKDIYSYCLKLKNEK